MKRYFLFSFFFFTGWAFYAPEQEPSIPKFRITSSQVVVDFVATDKTGRIVKDLRRDEIDIFEDGRKQSIEVFYAPEDAARRSALLSTQDRVRSGARMSAEQSGPTTGVAPTTHTVIAIDSRTIDSNNFVHSVAAIRQFIERHLAAGNAITLAEIYRGLKVITPMTRDKSVLLAGLDQLKPQSVYSPLYDPAKTSQRFGESYLGELQLQIGYLREGLGALCYSLAGQPGRKHIVFFSEGYPMNPLKLIETSARELVSDSRSSETRMAASREVGALGDPGVITMVRDVVSVANAFGVSFYAINARGLVAIPGVGPADRSGNVAGGIGAAPKLAEQGRPDLSPKPGAGAYSGDPETAGPSEQVVATLTLIDIGKLEDAQNTLIALAAGTNGLAFYNTNDLGVVLRYSTFEQENYYLVSYAPNTRRKPGQFHSIVVKCKRPDMMIRSRKGYLDVPDSEIQNARIMSALRWPELFKQLTPMVQIDSSAGKIQAIIGVPASQIQFQPKTGQFAAEILFRGMIYDSAGKPVSKDFPISRGFNLALTAEQLQSLGDQPLLAQNELKLSPGQYKVVLLVEDRLAGTLGAAVQEFRVP